MSRSGERERKRKRKKGGREKSQIEEIRRKGKRNKEGEANQDIGERGRKREKCASLCKSCSFLAKRKLAYCDDVN